MLLPVSNLEIRWNGIVCTGFEDERHFRVWRACRMP